MYPNYNSHKAPRQHFRIKIFQFGAKIFCFFTKNQILFNFQVFSFSTKYQFFSVESRYFSQTKTLFKELIFCWKAIMMEKFQPGLMPKLGIVGKGNLPALYRHRSYPQTPNIWHRWNLKNFLKFTLMECLITTCLCKLTVGMFANTKTECITISALATQLTVFTLPV